MHGFLWRALGLGIVTLLIGVTMIVLLWRSAQVSPSFYSEALAVPPETQQQASEEFSAATEEVVERIESNREWETSISEEQLNGWLAIDLQEILRSRGLTELEQPRCHIEADGLSLACRWKASGLGGVLLLECRPVLDADTESLTIEIHRVASGLLSVPRSRWLEPVRRAIESSELPVTWGVDQEPPSFKVDLSRIEASPGRRLTFESVELQEGAIVVSGSSLPMN